MRLSANVCVIGSGVAGAVVCGELLDAGLKDILMVEAGGTVKMRDLRVWHDFINEIVIRHGAIGKAGPGGPFSSAEYRESDLENVGPDNLYIKDLRALGGSTLRWGGLGLRLKPEDFRLFSNVGRGMDWPISYSDLEVFYSRAEDTLQVAGNSADAGHPPRSSPFPLPPFAAQETEGPFISAMTDMGYSTQHAPVSRNSRAIHGMPACQTTGTCNYCPIGGRFTGDQLIDRLEGREGFTLLKNTSVLEISLSSKQKVVGLKVSRLDERSSRRKVEKIEANLFVVCGGPYETPKLLMASANKFWPQGLGNAGGALGRYLMQHFSMAVYGTVPNPKRMSKQLTFATTISRHFDDTPYQADGKFISYPQTEWPKVVGALMKGESKASVLKSLSQNLDCSVSFYGEVFPDPTNAVSLAAGKDSLGLPALKVHYSRAKVGIVKKIPGLFEKVFAKMGYRDVKWSPVGDSVHPTGTCRMSKSDVEGVVDENLRVHGLENLYVCGASVFPTSAAANPGLTIVALAHRLGGHLAGKLKTGTEATKL